MNYSAQVHHCGVNGWGCCMPMKLNTYSDIRWMQHCITDRRKEIWAWKWCVRLVNLRELGECFGDIFDVLKPEILIILDSSFIHRKPAVDGEHWPCYTKENPIYYIFNAEGDENTRGDKYGRGPKSTSCAFWNEYLPRLRELCLRIG